MDSLRVDTGIKRIEVNDKGECIEFCVMDGSFFKGFSDLSKWLEELKAKAHNGENLFDRDGNADISVLDVAVAEYGKMGAPNQERIDKIFGADATRKVFCGCTPNIFTLSDFIEKISPFIKKYMRERQDSLSKKYSKGRKGAKS